VLGETANLSLAGGEMPGAEKTFTVIVEEILRRFCRQNGRPPPADRLREFSGRLGALVKERGLPRPLNADENGAPGELAEAECAPLLARVLGNAGEEERGFFAVPLRQLIKACFHEEFKVCRDSFREPSPDGVCRRQQLVRVRQRVSGAHCIDCPYWVALTPVQHGLFLEKEWHPAGREELALHRSIFLPEDFRELRRYLHDTARGSDIGL
jgi:hypothetical protein